MRMPLTRMRLKMVRALSRRRRLMTKAPSERHATEPVPTCGRIDGALDFQAVRKRVLADPIVTPQDAGTQRSGGAGHAWVPAGLPFR